MHAPVDLTRGGYKGDPTEEAFKHYTSVHLSYWWHFREVLRSSHTRATHWVRSDGMVLDDEGQKELVAFSLLNYATHTGIVESLTARDELASLLGVKRQPHLLSSFELRRQWSGAYSSLYSSVSALLNLVCLITDPSKPLVQNGKISTYSFTGDTKSSLKNKGDILEIFDIIYKRMEIRTQLGHYWLIWTQLRPDGLFMDEGFEKKGHIPLDGPSEYGDNVVTRLSQDINATASDLDTVYRELAVQGGFLDQFLDARGWRVKYDNDYGGRPHNGSRPQP